MERGGLQRAETKILHHYYKGIAARCQTFAGGPGRREGLVWGSKIATVIPCRGKGCRGKQRAARQGHGKKRPNQAARRCPLQGSPFCLSTQEKENSIHLPKAEPSGKCRKAEYGHKIFST
nr:MAG TPA: hypothetical protein [Caudoviricetes sp.]